MDIFRSTRKEWGVAEDGTVYLLSANNTVFVCALCNPFLDIRDPNRVTLGNTPPAAKKETSMIPNFCCSNCPHFHKFKNEIEITCSGLRVSHPIKEEPVTIKDEVNE